jgi:threonyl-tRNA synthetase
VDFNLPGRFKLRYSDKDGQVKQPIMIHRALLGSLERFFGVLIEHYGGFFPLWLAPVQVAVLPITDRNLDYAREIYSTFKEDGIRVELDDRSEGVGRKIRDAELKKIPYIVIIGDEEQKSKNIALRIHKQGDQGKRNPEEFLKRIKEIIGGKEFNYEI